MDAQRNGRHEGGLNLERFQESTSKFLDRHGFATFVAVAFFLVMIGALESPITENKAMLQESGRVLAQHIQDSKEEARKTNTRLLAACVNPALNAGDTKGARICMEDNEYLQKRLIERAIEEGENK